MIFKVLFLFLYLFVYQIECWQAIIERADISDLKPNYSKTSVVTFKYNRTTPALNATLELMVDLPVETIVQFKIYGLYSNTYKELPLFIQRNFCDFLNLEFLWIKDEMFGVYPTKCPIRKGYYYFYNLVFNSAKMPAKAWTTNNYKIHLIVRNPKEVWTIANIYVRTTTDDELRYE